MGTETQPPLAHSYIYMHAVLKMRLRPARSLAGLQFFRVFQTLQRFVVVELSNFYLDTAKDRLYIRAAADPARRACQTVLDALLRTLLAGLVGGGNGFWCCMEGSSLDSSSCSLELVVVLAVWL